MKKTSHEMRHCQMCNEMNKVRHESETWINANQALVDFPPLSLYYRDGCTRVWATNDTLFGFRCQQWEHRYSEDAPRDVLSTIILSDRSIAVLHDHMLQHWNSPASKRIRAARESISALMDGSTGEHPTVKAITEAVAAL